jgi:hypothetical protein
MMCAIHTISIHNIAEYIYTHIFAMRGFLYVMHLQHVCGFLHVEKGWNGCEASKHVSRSSENIREAKHLLLGFLKTALQSWSTYAQQRRRLSQYVAAFRMRQAENDVGNTTWRSEVATEKHMKTMDISL